MSTEPLGPDLYRYLVDTLYNTPAEERARSHWVMNAEWFDDIRRMTDARGLPMWQPPVRVDGPDVLLGLPIEIRRDAGVPELVAA